MHKYIIGIGAVILVVASALTFGRRTAKAPQAPEPYVIGVVAPFTGEEAWYGKLARDVVGMALDEINASGGVNGHTLEVVFEDGRCNSDDAAAAATKLVTEHKTQVILGGFCSGELLGALSVAVGAKAFVFSAGSSSADLTGIDPHFARNYPGDAARGQALAGVAQTDKHWKKIAIIQERRREPAGISAALSAALAANGIGVATETFAADTDDLSTVVKKLRGQRPDALFIDAETPAAAERVLQELKALSWTVPVLVSETVASDAAIIERNAAALEGAIVVTFGSDPANPKFRHLLDAYRERYQAELPSPHYAQTLYDAVHMIGDAAKSVGNDGETIATWVRMAQNWQGASGAVTIGQDGDRVGNTALGVVKGGKLEPYANTQQ